MKSIIQSSFRLASTVSASTGLFQDVLDSSVHAASTAREFPLLRGSIQPGCRQLSLRLGIVALAIGCLARVVVLGGLSYIFQLHKVDFDDEDKKTVLHQVLTLKLWDVSSAYRVGATLAKDPTVSAVFCGNDETAMGVIRGIHDSGLKVPQDISVVGFDDHPLASMFIPGLTTARQDFAELGRHGTAQLLALLKGESPLALETVEPPLIHRESAAPPPSALRARPDSGPVSTSSF